MLLPEAFNKNEALRAAMVKARPILDLAFLAADNAENADVRLDDANVLTNAQRHAERVGILRYKARIEAMYNLPPETPSPLMDSHTGLDAYDQLAIDAQREADEAEKNPTKPKKGK